MGTKIKIEFDEMNVQESVTYILSTEYGLKPNVLKAEIKEDSSGIMILTLEGDQSKVDEAIEGLKKKGFIVSGWRGTSSATKPDASAAGLCPTKSFAFDPETW